VLFRGSHHSDRLEIELIRRNIPYVKYGGLKFLEAAHVKDVLSILKWAENPKNEVAAFRVLKLLPGIGPGIASGREPQERGCRIPGAEAPARHRSRHRVALLHAPGHGRLPAVVVARIPAAIGGLAGVAGLL
jgi:hypothetical protein